MVLTWTETHSADAAVVAGADGSGLPAETITPLEGVIKVINSCC